MATEFEVKQSTGIGGESLRTNRITNYALWIIQGLLALLFLSAGGMKLVLPLEAMTKQIPLPGPFLRFIGLAEVLGAAGLVLPWLLRIRRDLTSLAASGLATIMVGATVVTLLQGSIAGAVMPFAVGILLVLIAYGRRPAPTVRAQKNC